MFGGSGRCVEVVWESRRRKKGSVKESESEGDVILSRHDDGTSIVTKKVLEEKGEGRAGKRRRNELHVPR